MPTGVLTLEVLGADDEERDRWRALWNAWPGAEVFAHPDYLELFAEVRPGGQSGGQLDARPSVPQVGEAAITLGADALPNMAGSMDSPTISTTLDADIPEHRLAIMQTPSGTVALPFTMRRNRLGVDLTGPYGYGGAFQWGEEPPVDAFWEAFEAWSRDAGVVSEFHRLHLFDTAIAPFPGTVRSRSANIVRDLTPDFDAIWADLERSVRKNVRAAQRHGVRIEIDEHADRLDEFFRIYTDTMLRRSASAAYLLPRSTFERLTSAMPGSFALAYALDGERVIAAELLLLSGGRAYSFLGGSDDAAFSLRPNDLLKVEVIRWAKTRGLTAFVLGGGHRAGDGIERFKRRFAPHGTIPFRTAERIHDTQAYAELCVGTPDVGGYFPAYRAPMEVAS